MKTTVVFLALALTSGMALTTASGCGLVPLLSNDACFIVKDDTGQLNPSPPSEPDREAAGVGAGGLRRRALVLCQLVVRDAPPRVRLRVTPS